jgi:hypothetical protein
VEDLAAALEATRLATALRLSRWTYPAVNTAHLLGVALLVGAVVPMDLRLAGFWRTDVGLEATLRLLRPVAAAGAALALATGVMLFAVQATEYVAQPLFWAKMALVAAGLAHALAWGGRLGRSTPARQRQAGLASIAIWLAVLSCGRMLGYL